MGNLFYDEPASERPKSRGEPRQPQRDYVMDRNGNPIRVGTRVRRLECYCNTQQVGRIFTVTLINVCSDPQFDGLSYEQGSSLVDWDADRFEVANG